MIGKCDSQWTPLQILQNLHRYLHAGMSGTGKLHGTFICLSGLRHVETYRLTLLWKNHCLMRKRKSMFLSIFLSLYLSIIYIQLFLMNIYIFKESRITSNYSGINRVPGFAFQHGMGIALSTRLMVGQAGQASISSAVTCCRPRKAALGSAQVWGLARAISHW